jgi:hypothetical protein
MTPQTKIMKTLFFALLLFSLELKGQPAIPDYGKINKADLELTDCSFDPGAIAYKLLDYGRVRFERGDREGGSNANDIELKVATRC